MVPTAQVMRTLPNPWSLTRSLNPKLQPDSQILQPRFPNTGQRDLLQQKTEVREHDCLPQGGPEGEKTAHLGPQLKSWDVPALPGC